jgi:hypothetical protein
MNWLEKTKRVSLRHIQSSMSIAKAKRRGDILREFNAQTKIRSVGAGSRNNKERSIPHVCLLILHPEKGM